MKTLGTFLRTISHAKYFVFVVVGIAMILFSASKMLAWLGVSVATMKEMGLGAVLAVLLFGGIGLVIYSLDKIFES